MQSDATIPFNKPAIVGREMYYIAQSVLNQHTSGDGPFTRQCRDFIERQFSANRALLTTSCTTALELSAMLLDIKHGDEVILPSYTFVSTANAFVLRGARPVFVDVRPDTLNIDEKLLPAAISPRTRAICVVHYAGVSCEMSRICEFAEKHSLAVVEDAAQAVNSRYKGQYLGTIGQLGTYSFHETKNFICGEGGALLVNDESLLERADVLREKGTDRSRFFRGLTDKYTWVDIGTSALPSDLLAAYLYAQLEARDLITAKRKQIYDNYEAGLSSLFEIGHLLKPHIPENCDSNYHMYFVRTRDLETRSNLISFLRQRGIHAVFHYVPLHSSPMGKEYGYTQGQLPVTENMSERVLRLPCYFDLTDREQERVVEVIHSFFG